MNDFQKLVVGLLCVVIVLCAFIVGFLMMNAGRSPVAPALPAVAEPGVVAPTPSPVKPAVASLGSWEPLLNGCVVELEGTKVHISGTNDQDGWTYNGVKGLAEYPVQDFEVSADFIVPVFRGTGYALALLQ